MGVTRVNYARNTLSPIETSESVCHFLGAGFSTACDPEYPVAHGFLGQRFGEVESYPRFRRNTPQANASGGPQLQGLLGRLEEQYGSLSEVNLEDVMTDLHVRAFGLGRAWEMTPTYGGAGDSIGQCARDYDELLDFIESGLFCLDRGKRDLDTARTFVQALLPQDSIVSLNYDTIVERHLEAEKPRDYRLRHLHKSIGPLSIGYGRGTPDLFGIYERPPRGILAKLHGSIDWYACANEDCPNRPFIAQGWLSDDDSRLTHGGARCNTCGSGVIVAIIPPTLVKPFERFPKLRIMWLLAFSALRFAQRWVFIGTSIAPTDFHLASLLRSASQSGPESFPKQICIVNKEDERAKEVADRLMHCLSPAVARRLKEDGESVKLFSSVKSYFDEATRVDANRNPNAADENARYGAF